MNAKEEVNRLAMMVDGDNGNQAGKSPPVPPPPIQLGNGITASLDGQIIRMMGSDQTELFNFPAQAAPFDIQPLSFLLQIYTLGYNKGRVIGREVTKAKMREVLGIEL